METNDTGWTLDGNVAIHRSGARLVFEGHPQADNFEIRPQGFPTNWSAPDLALLFRLGVDMYRAYRADPAGFLSARSGAVTPAQTAPMSASEPAAQAPLVPRQAASEVSIMVKRRRRVVVPPTAARRGG